MSLDIVDTLNNNQFSPNAISYKKLSAFLTKAKKETVSVSNSGDDVINENKEFNDLIADWRKNSKKLLLMLNKQDEISKKIGSSKSIMAFGAMGAHINMALQALKATEFDQ